MVDFGVMSATVTFNFITNENKKVARIFYGQSEEAPFRLIIDKFDQITLFHLVLLQIFASEGNVRNVKLPNCIIRVSKYCIINHLFYCFSLSWLKRDWLVNLVSMLVSIFVENVF